MHGFSHHGKMQQNKTHVMGKVWKIDIHTVPIEWVLFFQLDSHPMTYFIIWEMHGFPHQLPTPRENTTKRIA